MELLLDRGGNVDITTPSGLTPLHFAARFKIAENDVGDGGDGGDDGDDVDPAIALLVREGADLNLKDKYGLTPLHYACMRGNTTATDQLSRYPATLLDLGDEQDVSPLSLACVYGHTESVRLLLSVGADVWRTDDKKQSSLHKACTLSSSEIVRLLIKSVEDKHGDQAVLRFLDMEDSEKNSPLMISIESGNFASAKV